MSILKYKLLAAIRLAIDPNEILNCLEQDDLILVTTPDQEEHKFTKADLDRGAKKVAETGQKAPGSPSAEDTRVEITTIPVAKRRGKRIVS